MNILEILKKCPIGTKLYSPICGECELYNIHGNRGFDVLAGFITFRFLYDGRYRFEGDCCIFPSKDQRDWNKFQIPFKNGDKFDISTLKPFDKVLVRNYDHEEWDIEFFARRNDEKRFETLIGIYNQCIPYKGNEHLLHKTDDCDNYYKI